MVNQADSQASAPWATLEETAETFRRECESLDQLVEELFTELESLNLRLGHKSAEVVQQQEYIEQREEQWQERLGEHDDLREFFVHQNDQIAQALEKLADFEQKLGANEGDSANNEEMKGLLAELRAEHEAMCKRREEEQTHGDQEHERWEQLFADQSEQLGKTLGKLLSLEEKLAEVSQAVSSSGESPELKQLLEAVHEQHEWLQQQAEAGPADSQDQAELKTLLTQQEQHLAETLEKLASFEQQLAELATVDAASETPNPELQELLTEIRTEREELREQSQQAQLAREQDLESLEAFYTKQGDQLGGTLGKFNEFESLVKELASSVQGSPAEPSSQLVEFLEEIRHERDEFRNRFEQASTEAARLAELVSELTEQNNRQHASQETGNDQALAESRQTCEQLNQQLNQANSRVTELEQTVSAQQQELREEKQELREQLRELRELLELRSSWEAPATSGTQTVCLEPADKPAQEAGSEKGKQSNDSDDKSVLAQFAKLSRKK